jgi:hypothetical protein
MKSKKLILHSVRSKLDEPDLASHCDGSTIIVDLLDGQTGLRQQQGQFDTGLSHCCTSAQGYSTHCTWDGSRLRPELSLKSLSADD